MKIMLVLVRTMGDVILIHNIVDAILEKYGEAEIDVFVNESYKSIVEGNPRIKNIWTQKNWYACWDIVLNKFIFAGYDEVMIPAQLGREDNVWHQLEEYRHQHLLDFYLERCRLPRRKEQGKLQMFFSEENKIVVDEVLEVNKLEQRKYVVVHTTTLADGKNWSRFSELAELWEEENDLSVVQVGLKTDAKAYRGMSNFKFFHDMREKLTLPQIGILAGKAKCFIGLDSGLSHIAAAAGAKTIVLQGSTIPLTSGPWGDNVINILSKTRSECEKIRCHGNCRFKDKCINRIRPETVRDIVLDI